MKRIAIMLVLCVCVVITTGCASTKNVSDSKSSKSEKVTDRGETINALTYVKDNGDLVYYDKEKDEKITLLSNVYKEDKIDLGMNFCKSTESLISFTHFNSFINGESTNTLYAKSLADSSKEAKEVDDNVSLFMITNDSQYIIYTKVGDNNTYELWYYDYKNDENVIVENKLKDNYFIPNLGRNTLSYLDENNNLYYQKIGEEPIKISNSANNDFKLVKDTVYFTTTDNRFNKWDKDNGVSVIGELNENKNYTSVVIYNEDKMFILRDNFNSKIQLKDYIDDDLENNNSSLKSLRECIEKKILDIPTYCLYYYDGEKINLVNDEVLTWSYSEKLNELCFDDQLLPKNVDAKVWYTDNKSCMDSRLKLSKIMKVTKSNSIEEVIDVIERCIYHSINEDEKLVDWAFNSYICVNGKETALGKNIIHEMQFYNDKFYFWNKNVNKDDFSVYGVDVIDGEVSKPEKIYEEVNVYRNNTFGPRSSGNDYLIISKKIGEEDYRPMYEYLIDDKTICEDFTKYINNVKIYNDMNKIIYTSISWGDEGNDELKMNDDGEVRVIDNNISELSNVYYFKDDIYYVKEDKGKNDLYNYHDGDVILIDENIKDIVRLYN